MSLACAILAGGKNSRMGGKNKAFLTLNDITLLDRTIKSLESIFDEIIIVTNSPEKFDYLKNKCAIITDLIKNIGPLGGIYSALSHTKAESVFFVPCDMPHLSTELIKKQISVFNKTNCDAIVPRIGNRLEPLHSIFKKDINQKLHAFISINQKYYIRAFLNIIDVYYLDLDDNDFYTKVFTNINTPKDLDKLKYNKGKQRNDYRISRTICTGRCMDKNALFF